MHTASRRWGKGFGILDGRSVRFDAPAPMDWSADGVAATYACGPVELTVTRHIAADWSERYDLHNISGRMVAVGSLGISTPWRDVYESCRDSLDRAVYAHVWTGGADSWVWVVSMDGSAPGLGLRLTAGQLWAYSVGGVAGPVHRQQRPRSSLPTPHRPPPVAARVRRPTAGHTASRRPLPAGLVPRLAPSLADFHRARDRWVRSERVAAEPGAHRRSHRRCEPSPAGQ
jgi:hypothetical protein